METRWKQRLSSFKKATMQLTEFIEKEELNKFEVQGLIQCFEYTFELAWKTMKDYLELEGYDVDIAIYGEKINFDTISALHSLLEEHGPLPYFFDVVDYTHLNCQELKAHIDRIGVVIFSKEDDLPTEL